MSAVFINGPAKDVALELQRSPKFLRVCRAPDLTFDALDQIEDTPKPEEALIPYELVGEPTRGFIRRQGGGGAFTMARYQWIPDGPDDAVMRDAEKWRQWCYARVGKVAP